MSCVSQAVEFHRGSRVEDYEPLLELSIRLCRQEFLQLQLTQHDSKVLAEAKQSTLCSQTLRFLTAVVAGHSQKVGYSLS